MSRAMWPSTVSAVASLRDALPVPVSGRAPDESKRRQVRLLAASEHDAADDPGSWEVAQAVWADLEAIGRAYHRGELDEAALEARLTAVYDPLSLELHRLTALAVVRVSGGRRRGT